MDSFQSMVKFVPIHSNGLNIKEIICALALESLFTTGNKELTFIGDDNPTEVTVVKESSSGTAAKMLSLEKNRTPAMASAKMEEKNRSTIVPVFSSESNGNRCQDSRYLGRAPSTLAVTVRFWKNGNARSQSLQILSQ